MSRDLNCGSCHGCCHQLVSVDGEPAPKSGPWKLDPRFQNSVLQRRPDGACVYLDPLLGCSIYADRPLICRIFDCGDWARKLDPAIRRSIEIGGDRADREMLQSGDARR